MSELGTGPPADPEPPRAGDCRDPSRQLHRHARGGSQALLAPARSGIDRSDPGRVGDRGHLLVADTKPARDVEGELDGGAREVEVRTIEHAELDGSDGRRHGAYSPSISAATSISAAAATSFSVTPPASWVESEIFTWL